MELRRATGESQENLRQFYSPAHGWAGHWIKPITAMLELVIYLEDAVDFSPQWVGTSHENLIFVRPEGYRQVLASVYPLGEIHGGPAKARFEIHRPLETPWSHAVGYAEDVEQTWQMLRSVLVMPPHAPGPDVFHCLPSG